MPLRRPGIRPLHFLNVRSLRLEEDPIKRDENDADQFPRHGLQQQPKHKHTRQILPGHQRVRNSECVEEYEQVAQPSPKAIFGFKQRLLVITK